ncbi:MAG: ribonuclease [Pseudarcicella sp.]|nr:ribonuclease [Pseudarcicella sp.]MBP6410222.1 ribonuclease [Pseudarcicella sp.]
MLQYLKNFFGLLWVILFYANTTLSCEYRKSPEQAHLNQNINPENYQNRENSPVAYSKRQTNEIPEYVLKTLEYVKKNKTPLPNYVGGRKFGNYEKLLPIYDNDGNKIKYQEWDVHPKIPHKNRGKERLVTGSDESAYYTNNHYKSFKPIKNQ